MLYRRWDDDFENRKAALFFLRFYQRESANVAARLRAAHASKADNLETEKDKE